ncbi:unnamed protein product [Urochloa decumbens]|uniref:BI1-like protein n=1 Tax=Urochloa decumbens TaxID=240449 RepID=A0ABC8X3B2_9POAL
MGKHGSCSHDAEACYPPGGGACLYPYMMESPQIRWAFIRKVYAIVTLQLLLSLAVGATVTLVDAIGNFFRSRTLAALLSYVAAMIAPIIIMIPMIHLRKKHPINLVLLALFTVSISFLVGLGCLSAKGVVILEAVGITMVVVAALTAYTFWAAKKGYDFEFLGPFLMVSLLIFALFVLVKSLFPMGKTGTMVYGCIGALLFSGFIIYDTDNLIKRFSYDEYVIAAIELYLDIINLFQAMLALLEG